MGQPDRGSDDYLELGDWNAVCWVCGNKRKASKLKKHWQGYWVCPEHWEARHPQDFVKGITEKPTPPWVQPQPGAVYVNTDWLLCEDSGSIVDNFEDKTNDFDSDWWGDKASNSGGNSYLYKEFILTLKRLIPYRHHTVSYRSNCKNAGCEE